MVRRITARITAAVCAVAVLASAAEAQRTLKSIGRDLEHGVRDIFRVWASPLHADRSEWATFAGSVAFVGATLLIDDDIQRAMDQHPGSVVMRGLEPFREGHGSGLIDLGSGKRLQPLSGVLYLLGFAFDSRALRDAGLGCASTQQANILVHHGTYAIVARERPLTANGDAYLFELGGGPWRQHSFYGGHAGNIMGCVTYWNERFEMGPVEPVLYAVAIAVGFGRVADGRHWTSDTVTGMLIGHAFGRVIARRARARAGESGSQTSAPNVGTPIMGVDDATGRLVLGWRGVF